MTIQSTTLKNGLRVITDTVNTVESVALGVWCDVGTRHEDMAHNGVAHMVEHMMFNGTKNRTSKDIVQHIESVGGQMNAYTSRENTAYYVHLLKEDARLALEVISDMLQHSVFPDHELEKERGVIIQEIGMTNDTPDDLVFDLYQETAYPGQALGAPILGTASIIEAMKKETLSGYVQRFYTPKNLVISAAGNVSHDEILTYAQDMFGHLPANQNTQYPKADYQGGEHREDKDLEQSHVVLGFQGVHKSHPDYYAAMLLSTILGGGMSSRLFQEVREKHGLVYSVYSSHSAYQDDGQFEIYAGTGPDKLSKLIPVICDELQKIIQTPVAEEELARAQSQIRSSILMGRESMLSRANRQAKYLINFDEEVDIQKILEKVSAVQVTDISKMAQKIFSSKPTLAALGPLEKLESYAQIQGRLAA
ncbi:MAG TPA: pitrilysin family protein [Alphaproteobacteria bacterium]|nr:pitrilysin family protein [Alphaproteobacteria bacterium]